MPTPNLFDDKYKVKMGFWDYRKLPVGSRIQGTLVAKRTVPDTFKPGQDQMVYDIRVEAGDVVSVFGKASIDSRMKGVRLGQIVAMEYKGEIPAKKPGMKPAKIVEVYADPNVVDEEWLKEQEELKTEQEIDEAAKAFQEPPIPNFAEETPAATAGDPREETIKKLALEKIPGTTEENWKKQVISSTGLAFLPFNYDKIAQMLG